MKAFKIILSLCLILFLLASSCYFLFFNSNNKEEKLNFPKEEPIIKKEPNHYSAQLTFVGDFLFEQPYYDAISKGEDKDLYFRLIKPYFENDDLSVGNMEVVIGNETLTTSGVGYNFCAPSWIGDLVSTLDLEVLSTANNHAFDRGKEGIISTIDFFKNHTDILTLGTYKEESDRDQLTILEKNGIKFGFLAYTMSTNIKPKTNELYMVHYYKEPTSSKVTLQDKERMKRDVEKLKKEVDVVIVLMHWGYEYTFEINETQRELANFFNSLGVHIIVGSHSHNIQPMEWIGEEHKTLVYYSMGNFVAMDDYIERTTETFNNAYQVGLLSRVQVTKENDFITIHDITTEPVINYYDNHLRNFMLIPYHQYTEEFEKTHKRYQNHFNKQFIDQLYQQLIPEEFRQ